MIANVLSLDDMEMIDNNKNIINDLGAESIDFVDMCFLLEKEFGIAKVNVNDIFPISYLNEDIFNEDGNIKDSIFKDLKENYHHITDEFYSKLLETKDQSILFTVKIIENYVCEKMK